MTTEPTIPEKLDERVRPLLSELEQVLLKVLDEAEKVLVEAEPGYGEDPGARTAILMIISPAISHKLTTASHAWVESAACTEKH